MSQNRNFLFVSDLHLSEGRYPDSGKLSRNEDFFQDVPFARLVAFHAGKAVDSQSPPHYRDVPWMLVINGDVFDFLQVVSLPKEGAELAEVKGVTTYEALKELSTSEAKYGLGTRSPEIVWKLRQVAKGHPVFFQALAWFVAHEGNRLVLMKGNHDIELYWPEVQAAFRDELVAAYGAWRTAVSQTHDNWPLPWHDGLPEALDRAALDTAVTFPAEYYLEPGLFYAEHGCQYDPINCFTNFSDPRLMNKPDLIELPSGSFFVRYFFNKVEEIHPFADNIKPIIKYINWVINNAPSAAVRVLVDLLPKYVVALFKLKKKQFQDWRRRMQGQERTPQANLESAAGRFENDLRQVQARIRKQMGRMSKLSSLGTIASLVFKLGGWLLLFTAVRAFVNSDYGATVLYLVLSGLAGFAGSYLVRLLDEVLASSYLLTAAKEVNKLLNAAGDLSSVPFLIYGHDHVASLHKLGESGERPFPQWYINTGTWIPVFKEDERLLREDVQLTFLRLVPGKPGFLQQPPELLQWDADADRPREIRMFETGE